MIQQPSVHLAQQDLSPAFITVAGLRKSYTAGVVQTEVLKGLDLQLEQGEIGVILGPSGSGKTTLMNIIGGIDRADSGEVTVDGTGLSLLSDDQLTTFRRDQVGFVFQFYNLVPNLTVVENIEVVSNISSDPLDIQDVLAAVDMQQKKTRFPRELSGGEQQRVSIARAVIKNPRLLLCDEPTGALDYATARSILTLLQQINHQFGTTILMVTHNAAIAGMANRVYKLRGGEVVEAYTNPATLPAERIEW